MELNYENMKAFMERYFKDYSSHVNSIESIEKLDELYTSDFVSNVYMHVEGKEYPFVRKGREEFKKTLIVGHVTIKEKLYANNIIIDEKKKIAGVLLTSEKVIRSTGKKYSFDGIGFYHLTSKEDNKIKIKRLDIFCDDPDKLNKIYFENIHKK